MRSLCSPSSAVQHRRSPVVHATIIVSVCCAFFAISTSAPQNSLWAFERVEIEREGELHSIDGRIEVEAQDGGLLLLGRAGRLWAIRPEEIVNRETLDGDFAPFAHAEFVEHQLAKLPPGFKVHKTAHFVIFYGTSKAYAQWCGGLFERLYSAFYNFWKRKGLKLKAPTMPLAAIVFEDKSNYVAFSQEELGAGANSIVGYYSLRSNQIVTYDLTGSSNVRVTGRRPTTTRLINQLLSKPEATSTVSTLIHEATHQLAYNSGLQVRYADNPLWLSEGLAIYFETPDLKSSRGWRSVGAVSPHRLNAALRAMAVKDEFVPLLTDDQVLRAAATAVDSYGESWALCYFLLKKHPKSFAAYLEELGQKRPLKNDTSKQRLLTFQKHFGDLNKVYRDFSRYVQSMR